MSAAGREGDDGAGDGLAVAELAGVFTGDIRGAGAVSELGLRDILQRLVGAHLVHAGKDDNASETTLLEPLDPATNSSI